MPRDSSGQYTLPAGNPVVPDTEIESVWANDTMSDLAIQLNNVLTRDGLLGPLAPMKFVNGTLSAPGMTFNADPTVGVFLTSNYMGFTYKGVLKISIGATVGLSAGSTVPTPDPTSNDTKVASTAFVNTVVAQKIAEAIADIPPVVPTGTRMLFAQATAPVGWVQDTSDVANNRMLRVVNDGSGGAVGGTNDPTVNSTVSAHTHGVNFTSGAGGSFSGTAIIGRPGDFGAINGVTGVFGEAQPQSNREQGTGGGGPTYAELTLIVGDHTHTVSGDTASNGGASNWAPRYNNIIVCVKS